MVQKHKHVRLREWLEIVYWRQQGFFTLKLTHRKVLENRTKQVAHMLPGGTLLRQMYSILVFLFTQSLASRTQNTYAYTQKACNHTQGDACAPLQLVTLCFDTPAWTKRRPSTITHAHTHWNTCTSVRGGAVRECKLEGRGRIKQLLNSDCETYMWLLVLWNIS